jgi:hypothetical protein
MKVLHYKLKVEEYSFDCQSLMYWHISTKAQQSTIWSIPESTFVESELEETILLHLVLGLSFTFGFSSMLVTTV